MKRFIHDYSTQTHHLQKLLREDKDNIWTETHEQVFNNLKQSCSSESSVSYFDNHRVTFIYTDASPHGILAILLQKSRNQENCKIVAYSSWALTSVEKDYSQLECECIAVVYGCEKNCLYLLGRPFTIYSNHKPITTILNKCKTIVPLHIERLILCLQGYDFKIAHISSNENISDNSSRHPFAHPQESNQYLKEYISFVCKNACPKALTLDDVKQAAKNDKTLQKLKYLILENKWFKIQKHSIKSEKELNIDELKMFSRIKDSLAVNDTGDVILQENQMVLPSIY